MKHLARSTLLAALVSLGGVYGVGNASAQSASGTSPLGRWITASGNLEVDIAPCGNALCGTVTKVLANHSMSRDGEEMQPADARPALGMQLLKGFVPSKLGEASGAAPSPPIEWTGEIYNRENGKTYSCSMSLRAAGTASELVLRPYIGMPIFGKTQVWRRAVSPEPEPAPEFSGLEHWFNSSPLTMASLRGKVVLVDFWTHTCGNCINTLPHVEALHQRYKDRGLVVVGVHTPETAPERDPEHVRSALQRFGIHYPVAMDNHFRTWAVWHNQYWPALYLVNKEGRVVYKHVGEGDYATIEQQVQKALQ